MSMNRDPEVLADFVQECRAYVPGLLAVIDQPANDPTLMAEVYRHFHSVAGTASLLGLTALSHLAAAMERPLEELAITGLTHADRMQLLRQSAEAFQEYVDRLLSEDTPDSATIETLTKDWTALDELMPLPEFPRFDELEPPPEFLPDTIEDSLPEEIPPSTINEEEIPSELVEVFRLEAEEHLRTIQSLLPQIQPETIDREMLQEVRRSAHTLKGSAAMVGFRKITQLAHRMEDLLDAVYEGSQALSAEGLQLLIETADTLDDLSTGQDRDDVVDRLYQRYSQHITESEPVSESQVDLELPSETPSVLDYLSAPSENPRKTSQYLRVPIEKLDELVRLVSELVISRSEFKQRLSGLGRQVEELQLSTVRLGRSADKLETEYEAKALASERLVGQFESRGGRFSGNTGFDDLELDRYTNLHLISRELGETSTDIRSIGNELGQLNREFEGYLTRQTRLSSDLQDKLMRVRMVPLATLTNRLDRTVRHAASTTGKHAKLIIAGENTELDKSVLEEMAEPLMHLLRNAVDHGLESLDDRLLLGKPPEGTVRVRAFTEGTQVVIQISDDGSGIDYEKIRASAINRGLVSEEQGAILTETQLQAILFQPGFSTAKSVSEISGRGVGLDVVTTQVNRLKGTLSLKSELGQGTTFTIRLPLTLAVMRALLVTAGGQPFAIPLGSVAQILRLEESARAQIGDEPVINLNGRVYPRVLLSRVLNLKVADDLPARPPLVIVNVGDQQVAVVFDTIIGGREIVVKNLGNHVRHVHGIAGATVMGDGSVVLIINPGDLLSSARTVSPVRTLKTSSAIETVRRTRTVLVVDDSPSVRRIVTTLLRSNGWEPIPAKDGVDALEILNQGARPDAILLDVEMPRMDGYEFLSTIRAHEQWERLPVVMVTSRAGDKHRRKALDLGASAYLVKPYQDEFLLRTLRDLISQAESA